MADAGYFQRMERLLEPGRALSQPGLLETVNKTGSAHYTEEAITIPETLASQAAANRRNAFGKNGP